MSFGPLRVFSDSIASGASTSGGVDLVKAWSKVGIQVGTMSTAVSLSIQNSADGGSTFYQVYAPTVNTATVGVFPLAITQSVGANGGYVVFDGVALSYPRVVGTGVVSGGVSIKYVCLD